MPTLPCAIRSVRDTLRQTDPYVVHALFGG